MMKFFKSLFNCDKKNKSKKLNKKNKKKLPKRLYGRKEIISNLKTELNNDHKVILIWGASGIGKSSILDSIRPSYFTFDSSLTIDSPTDSREKLYSSIAQSLLPHIQGAITNLRENLNKHSSRYAGMLTKSFFKDVIGAIAPLSIETANTLTEIATEVLKDSSMTANAEEIIQENDKALSEKIKNLILLADIMNINGLIKIDCLSSGSEEMHNAIYSMAKWLPQQWVILIALDDQHVTRRKFALIVNELRHYSRNKILKYEINPLIVNDVEKWASSIELQKPSQDKLSVIMKKTKGIPFFVERYFQYGYNQELTMETYAKQLDELENSLSSRIAHILAILPQSIHIPESLLRIASGVCSAKDLQPPLRELKNQFFIHRSEENSTVRLYHKLLSDGVRCSMSRDLKVEIADTVFDAFESLDLIGYFETDQLNYIKLYISRWTEKVTAEEGANIANDLIRNGKLEAGLTGIEALENGRQEKLSDVLQQRISWVKAEAMYYRGDYIEAINLVQKLLEDSPEAKVDHLLLYAKILLRVGRYDPAIEIASNIADNESLSTSVKLKALRCLNVIYRDRGLYPQAKEIIDKIHRLPNYEDLKPAEICDVRRTEARTYCLTPDRNSALDFARQAIAIAEDNKLPRKLGNSYLAYAEALRHNNANDESLKEYLKAIDYAEENSDKDSLFWSILGLSDAHIRLKQFKEAEKTLESMHWLIDYWGNERPFESAHYDFSKQILNYLDSLGDPPEVPQFYEDNNMSWPKEYLHSILKDPNELPAKRF